MVTSLLELKHTTTPSEYADFIKTLGEFSWWRGGDYWLVTEYNLAKDILTDSRFSCDRTPFFLRRMKAIDLPVIQHFYAAISKMMVMSDEPEHQPRRRICFHGIVYYMQNNLPTMIHNHLQTYLNKIKTNHFDFVKEIAMPLPADVMSDLFAIPASEKTRFYKASHDMTMFFGGASKYTNKEGAQVDQNAKYLNNILAEVIAYKKKNLSDDFISILLSKQSEYNLDDDDLISQMIMLLVAGQVTLTDQMCNNFYTIFNLNTSIENNNFLDYLRLNPDKIDDALIEANRLDPAVTFIFRVASSDFNYSGQAIKKGDAVFISSHAVNRDPQVFSEPNTFNINNSKLHAKNYSFGYGKHFCLGSKVAMLQMRLTLSSLLDRYKSIAVDQANSHRAHESLAFSGFHSLALITE